VKHLSRLLARLYPARWRERYGDEFDALIEDSRATWRSTFDVLRGALILRAVTVPSLRTMAVVLATFGVITAWVVRYELIGKPIPIEIRAVDHVPAPVREFESCAQVSAPDNCGFRDDTDATRAVSSIHYDGQKLVIAYDRNIPHELDRARMLADVYRNDVDALLPYRHVLSPIAAALCGLFAGLLLATLFAALRRLQNRLT
jgi:hypothetical protein